MNYQYHLKTNTLSSNGIVLTTIAHEMNEIGACAKCAGSLNSLSAHRGQKTEEKAEEKYYIVSSCMQCLTIYVHQYDSNWSWMDEDEPELMEFDPAGQKSTEEKKEQSGRIDHINNDESDNAGNTTQNAFQIPIYNDIVSSYDDFIQIPLLKLKSVFSEAEIQTLIQKSKKEKYIRQYYHRAKKKYKDFEEIFGI
jgi:hypothetical protein